MRAGWDEETKLDVALLRLSGEAEAWADSKDFASFPEFKEAFESRFCQAPPNALLLLNNSVQGDGESVDQYTDRFLQICYRLQLDIGIPFLVTQYVQGMKGNLCRDVLISKPSTILEAHQEAHYLEQLDMQPNCVSQSLATTASAPLPETMAQMSQGQSAAHPRVSADVHPATPWELPLSAQPEPANRDKHRPVRHTGYVPNEASGGNEFERKKIELADLATKLRAFEATLDGYLAQLGVAPANVYPCDPATLPTISPKGRHYGFMVNLVYALYANVEQKVVACFDALESEGQDTCRPAVAEARVAVPNLSDWQSHCYVKKPESFYGNGLSGEGTCGLADEEHFKPPKMVLLAGFVKRSNYKHAGTVAADVTDVPALEQSGTRTEGLGLSRNRQLPGALAARMPVSLKGQCTPARRLLSMLRLRLRLHHGPSKGAPVRSMSRC